MSGTYFFEGRKSDFSFVTVFYLFPSNFVPDARGPPRPICVLHTTHMGPFKILPKFGKKLSSLHAFAGVQSLDAVMYIN